jgi:Tfp pilus assembly protein PilE
MMIVVTIMAILISFGLPFFQKAIEQNNVDMAAANLDTIFTAERLYYAQNRVFSDSLDSLENAGLLDPSFVRGVTGENSKMQYCIVADENSFTANAARVNSSHWSGEISIDEQGNLAGEVVGTAGEHLVPVQL